MSAVAIFDNNLTSQDLFKSPIIYLVIIIFKIIITISNVTESILYMYTNFWFKKGQSAVINDVPHFLTILYLPTYLVLLYNVRFWGLSWTTLPTLILEVINGRSPIFDIGP